LGGRSAAALDGDLVLFLIVTYFNGIAVVQFAFQDLFCNRVLQVFLDRPLQWTCTKAFVESFFCDELLGGICEPDLVTQIGDPAEEPFQFNIDDPEDIFLAQAVEDDHIVDTVQELRGESPFKRCFNYPPRMGFRACSPGGSRETNALPEILQ